MAFGFLLTHEGYPWILAPVMSLFIYAGAGQYIAVRLFAGNVGLATVAIITLLVNSRHMVYGLSLLERFQRMGSRKLYAIFALTDETYALLTSVPCPPGINEERFTFYLSLLNQSYWFAGSTLGAIAGSLLPFRTDGLDFALTALFVVLLVEQYRGRSSRLPFLIALGCGAASLLIVPGGNGLILAIASAIVILLLVGRRGGP
jgi:4-azaleucine resistance transporter AzlC